jgi:uncharacterized protein (TIGR02246 family)
MERPSHVHRLYEAAFNAQDLKGLLALYTPVAKLIPERGREVVGHQEIGAALQQFLDMDGRIKLETAYVIEAGDLALSRGRWTLKGTGPDGKPVTMEGHCIDVLERQADGSWLLAIDNPFGGD